MKDVQQWIVEDRRSGDGEIGEERYLWKVALRHVTDARRVDQVLLSQRTMQVPTSSARCRMATYILAAIASTIQVPSGRTGTCVQPFQVHVPPSQPSSLPSSSNNTVEESVANNNINTRHGAFSSPRARFCPSPRRRRRRRSPAPSPAADTAPARMDLPRQQRRLQPAAHR